ncbi:hypothetical protein QYE76_039591 [Lolium multiflorum]|uniref:Retrotransposon gag domain-containing protein n=1 Tax=Lolium multiflorum TaxID=4521 RepID=A0AAD8TBN8_LOLMU|nr:hypothetical protein QYE76_039591 [Lolium multiflorum]
MGKPRDPKVAILPSTTRKGTILSTSATLDSPSVIDKLVSPPHASHAGTSAESENSHNIDNISAVLDDSGSLGSFLDATIARSRQIENTETPNATTPVNSPELDYFSDDPDEDYVELNDDFIEKCNATTDARKIKKLLAEHAVRYKLSPDPKFATSPINIKDKDYDFSLDLSHIAIVEKTPFCGTEKESAVEHMIELSTLSSLFSDDVKMRTYFVAKIFPFSLKDDAKTWYNSLPPNSIKSPKELLDVFFRKYFPASAQHIALQRIYNFDQEDGEKLPEAWARFCSLIRARPDHDLEKHDLLDIFYSGLTIESRAYLDSCAGCVFRKRTPDDAEELLAKIGRNHDDWTTPEPTPTPILKKRGMIKLNDEDMREAKKSLKEKGIKSEDVKNLPPIEDICEIIPPSSMIEDPLYPEGHPKRIEQDSQRIEPSAPSKKKKKKKHKNVVESSEPANDPNSISISDAETESGNEHDKDNDKNDASDKEEVEEEPEKHAKNKKEEMKKFNFGELFKKGTTSTGRPSRAATRLRRSYNEDIIAPSFAPEEDNGAPNASSFPCYDFLRNAGILDDFFTLVNRAGLATYVGDEREQYYMLTKIFVESFRFNNTQYEPTVAFKIYGNPVTMELEDFCRALDIAPVGLFSIDRQSWSRTKEEVDEHMKIQDFHQQHDSEDAEASHDYTVTYPGASSSTYPEYDPSSSYYGDTTSCLYRKGKTSAVGAMERKATTHVGSWLSLSCVPSPAKQVGTSRFRAEAMGNENSAPPAAGAWPDLQHKKRNATAELGRDRPGTETLGPLLKRKIKTAADQAASMLMPPPSSKCLYKHKATRQLGGDLLMNMAETAAPLLKWMQNEANEAAVRTMVPAPSSENLYKHEAMGQLGGDLLMNLDETSVPLLKWIKNDPDEAAVKTMVPPPSSENLLKHKATGQLGGTLFSKQTETANPSLVKRIATAADEASAEAATKLLSAPPSGCLYKLKSKDQPGRNHPRKLPKSISKDLNAGRRGKISLVMESEGLTVEGRYSVSPTDGRLAVTSRWKKFIDGAKLRIGSKLKVKIFRCRCDMLVIKFAVV